MAELTPEHDVREVARERYAAAARAAGFEDVEIRETHRVHQHAASAIIRARKSAE